ncbi:type VI secretion system accessory protein TagJ [Hydromonas duriensis]|uniref:Type VI secretion system protein ImpE n=1 Tax=Hydromonas duriensis TaxID=1527608 RepID=A0A4R6YBM6_9BURK|nr:type VI secretion system accessory protein TagJ [Hydromonas duriensis]TDR33055.1 type VI secretion system protein ImpE [Hydromonas duriensis]
MSTTTETQTNMPDSGKLAALLNGQTLEEAFNAAEQDVKKHPSSTNKRFLLFQLMIVMGQWKRALQQLQTLAKLDESLAPMARIYGDLIRAEVQRGKVFAGESLPHFLQEPPDWSAGVVQAMGLSAQSRWDDADEVRQTTFAQIPDYAGTFTTDNGEHSFDWWIDSDSRIGPMFEVIVKGQYMWLALETVQSVELSAPDDLRDLVWGIAHFTLRDGTNFPAFMPCRYPLSEQGDDATRLARATTWQDNGETTTSALGQRVWACSNGDVSMLDARRIEFK